MKLKPAETRRFLAHPSADVDAALIYGPDRGLALERAGALHNVVSGGSSDPFSFTELSAKTITTDPARLTDEVSTLSLSAARRVVRVRDATDGVTEAIKRALLQQSVAAFVIIDAGDLGPRSSLRRFFEDADNTVAIACYSDDPASLADVIRATVREAGKTIEPEAETLLMVGLGADRSMTRMELEKLILYAADQPNISATTVSAVLGVEQTETLTDAVFAVFAGNIPASEAALQHLLAGGVQPVSILRAAAAHAMRLHLAISWTTDGASAKSAINRLKPKVFFRQVAAFQRQINIWTEQHLATALELLTETELKCKSTGSPAAAVSTQALLRIAQASAQQSATRSR